jgi:hypothetical protein
MTNTSHIPVYPTYYILFYILEMIQGMRPHLSGRTILPSDDDGLYQYGFPWGGKHCQTCPVTSGRLGDTSRRLLVQLGVWA